MKEKSTQNFEFIKKEWDTILAYERYNFQERKDGYIPVDKILNYFGDNVICELFGCTIVTTTIAKELIKESFK